MHVTWTGDVILCPVDFEGAMQYGNVRKNTLREIWYGEPHKKVLRDHGAGRFEGLCAACNFNTDREAKTVILSKAERIALRRKHADSARTNTVRCEHAPRCEIVNHYLKNLEAIESIEDDLVAICSDDYRFYGLDAVRDPKRHPHCPALARLRAKLADTRICWESSVFGPSGYAFAGRGHIFGLEGLGARVHAHPILGDCKVEMGIEEDGDG
jgi:hypothetical protein